MVPVQQRTILLLDTAQLDARHKILLEERIDAQHGDHRNKNLCRVQRRIGHHGHLLDLLRRHCRRIYLENQLLDVRLQGIEILIGGQNQPLEEIIPVGHDGKQRHRGDHRLGQRDDDMNQDRLIDDLCKMSKKVNASAETGEAGE